MNQTITLHPHQEDAVWRGMSSGNTLLAHAVGAGKTFTMAATGMKMKQAGLIQKPLYAVPNHMLEQFAREFMQLYPNAKLLIAGKEDLTRERRKFLTAKVASGEWDGIIVTHSSFERIGMSRDYQAKFLREQIQEYDQLLRDSARGDTARGNRNLIKTIEKQKANREQRLKELLAEDKKDDGLVFDELGVDHIFIDEAHFFKNLETPTKPFSFFLFFFPSSSLPFLPPPRRQSACELSLTRRPGSSPATGLSRPSPRRARDVPPRVWRPGSAPARASRGVAILPTALSLSRSAHLCAVSGRVPAAARGLGAARRD